MSALHARLRQLARLSRRAHFPEVVALALSCVAVLLGLTMVLAPTAYRSAPTLA